MYLARSIMFESITRFYFLTTPSRDRTVIPSSVFIQTIVTCKPALLCWSGRDLSPRPKEVTSILLNEPCDETYLITWYFQRLVAFVWARQW